VVDALVALAGAPAEDTLVVNVQGEQPFLDPRVIDAMATEFGRRAPLPEVLTPVYRIGAEKVHNPNVVKTLVATVDLAPSGGPYGQGDAAGQLEPTSSKEEWVEPRPVAPTITI
jgi:hypothetical protein